MQWPRPPRSATMCIFDLSSAFRHVHTSLYQSQLIANDVRVDGLSSNGFLQSFCRRTDREASGQSALASAIRRTSCKPLQACQQETLPYSPTDSQRGWSDGEEVDGNWKGESRPLPAVALLSGAERQGAPRLVREKRFKESIRPNGKVTAHFSSFHLAWPKLAATRHFSRGACTSKITRVSG